MDSCNHDFQFSAKHSLSGTNGIRRYQCSLCKVWAWRQGNRSPDKPEFTVYDGPIVNPLDEWTTRQPFGVNHERIAPVVRPMLLKN